MQKLTITILGLSTLIAGCSVTNASLSKERRVVRTIEDINAGRAIKARMMRADYDMSDIKVDVAEGIVVLSGYTDNPDVLKEAERIAWSAPNIAQVGNEVKFIDDLSEASKGLIKAPKDSLLASAIRVRLVADGDVKSQNVKISTDDGIVYLMGIARTPEELERIAEIAGNTKGVEQVISYLTYPNGETDFTAAMAAQAAQAKAAEAQAAAEQASKRAVPSILSKTPDKNSPPPAQAKSAQREAVPNKGEAPTDEPYYRDPKTGERIFLAPGTKTVPYLPGDNGAAHYIDPSTGQKVQIVYRKTR